MGRPRLAAGPAGRLGCALMGALIVSRHPRHRLGLAAVRRQPAVGDPGRRGLQHLGARRRRTRLGRAGHTCSRWAAPLLGWPAFTALIMVFLSRPDGHLPSPRWRWAVWVTAVVGLGLHTLGTLTTRPSDFVYGEQYDQHPVSEPAPHRRLPARRGRARRLGRLAGRASAPVARTTYAASCCGSRSSAAFLAVGVVVILAVPRLHGRGGHLAGRRCRCASPRSPSRSAWPSPCCATGCSRST